jgi:hypothetical protein
MRDCLSSAKRTTWAAWTVGIATSLAIIGTAGVARAGEGRGHDHDDEGDHDSRRGRGGVYYYAPPPMYYRAPPPVAYVPVYPAPVYDYQQPMYYGPAQPSVTLTIPLR